MTTLNTNTLFDEVSRHLTDIRPDYNSVFDERNPVQTVKKYIESGSNQRFHFFNDDSFHRCSDIPVTFIHADGSQKIIRIKEKDDLEQHLQTTANGNRTTRLLTEFFTSQDAYFGPLGEVGMGFQSKGLHVNIPSIDPISITVTSKEKVVEISYVFYQSMMDMTKWSKEFPTGTLIGKLVHQFGYTIDRKTNEVAPHSKPLTIGSMEDLQSPFHPELIEDHFKAPIAPGENSKARLNKTVPAPRLPPDFSRWLLRFI